MDLPYYSGADIYTNRAQTLKQSVEEALQGCVVVNPRFLCSAQEWYYAGYYTESGKDANYTLYDVPVGVLTTVIPQPTSTPCSVTAQVTWLSASVSSNTAFAQ